jgi:DNA invertase Pin-like site-specific DNA recombinase
LKESVSRLWDESPRHGSHANFFRATGDKFASIAEFERELIRDRVRSGIARARAKGRRLGRPRSEVDLNRLKTLRAAGCSWRTIADELGVAVSVAFKAYKASAAATSPGVVGVTSLSEENSERFIAVE